jgi:hypothetical protein
VAVVLMGNTAGLQTQAHHLHQPHPHLQMAPLVAVGVVGNDAVMEIVASLGRQLQVQYQQLHMQRGGRLWPHGPAVL